MLTLFYRVRRTCMHLLEHFRVRESLMSAYKCVESVVKHGRLGSN